MSTFVCAGNSQCQAPTGGSVQGPRCAPAGARFVPFKVEEQRIFVSSFKTALKEVGPVEYTSYK